MFPMSEEARLKFLEQVKDAGEWKIEFIPEKVIQDAQEAAGNRMYVKALDDLDYRWRYDHYENDTVYAGEMLTYIANMKAKFIEEVTKK